MKKFFTLLAFVTLSFSVANAQQEPTKEQPKTEKKCEKSKESCHGKDKSKKGKKACCKKAEKSKKVA